MLKHIMMGAVLAVAGGSMGCSKSGATGGPAAAGAERLSKEGQATLKAAEEANKVPAGLRADGVTISGVAVRPGGGSLEITGSIKNGSNAPVEGVNLSVTFMDDAGIVVGGHSTQHFFQPPLGPGKDQAIVILAPALPGAQGKAVAAEIKVLNLAKAGEAPDGWKPLDPENMPEAKIVPGPVQQVTADGQVIDKPAQPPAPSDADRPVEE